jgi:hypothetical protein
MVPDRLRIGHPPLGPPCLDMLDPVADSTPASFSRIEGWPPDEFRAVKLMRVSDVVAGARFLEACQAVLTPSLSWIDVRDVCVRMLVASAHLSTARRARISASEACKAMACLPYHMQTLYECDRWLWGRSPIPAARIRYDELRKELDKRGSGEPCGEFHEWWVREHRRSVTFSSRQLDLF